MIELADMLIFFASVVLIFGAVLLYLSQKENDTKNKDRRSQDKK